MLSFNGTWSVIGGYSQISFRLLFDVVWDLMMERSLGGEGDCSHVERETHCPHARKGR